MRIGRPVCMVIVAVLIVGCATSADGASNSPTSAAAEATVTEPVPTPLPPTAVPPTAVPPTAVPPTAVPPTAVPAAPDTTEQEAEPSMNSTDDPPDEPESSEPDPVPDCVQITDFAVDAENLSWFIVNDNVMGGRSSGGPTFVDSAMVFEGEINTDGGGFSSVRVQLGLGALEGFTELKVRARTDGRAFKLLLEDGLPTRDRRVSQQGALGFAAANEWQTATVRFDELEPKIFGRSVETEAFRPDLATQLGIMISDGVDGPFRIEIDWIEACR